MINTRIPGAYVKTWEEFEFTTGALKALCRFASFFDHIIIITNQQGVGKGLMTAEKLDEIHDQLKKQIQEAGGRIDAIYACTELKSEDSNCRKPSPAMALWAKMKYPEIDFAKSIMIGDSLSDMEFGGNLGMYSVFVEGKQEEAEEAETLKVDLRIKKLADFSSFL